MEKVKNNFNFSKGNGARKPRFVLCMYGERRVSSTRSIFPLYYPQRARIVLPRIRYSYPFSEYAISFRCMCVDPWSPTRSHVVVYEDERERDAGDSANQCSGRNVAIGGWCSGEMWGWFGSKGRACSSTFFYLRLYFSPFHRDTVFVLQRASSQRTKGEMRKCAETLTSLFWNALISVDCLIPEGEKETRDIENKRLK